MKRTLTYLYLVLFIVSCKKAERDVTPVVADRTPDIVFGMEAKYNAAKIKSDVTLLADSGRVSGSTNEIISSDMALVASFTTKPGAIVTVNGIAQTSGVTVNDFSKPVVYTVAVGGSTKIYTLIISNFTGLPVFTITTSGPIISKDDYVTGHLSINAMGRSDQDITEMDLQMKGRGNSTWAMPKKPYRLKLNTKAKMFGLTAAKNWVLLANYADKTLMRNYLADELAQAAKSDFAPHGVFVDVILNGDFVGNYLLTEQVEINPGRVNITAIKPTDITGAALTGGYLVELDKRNGEVVNWVTDANLPMNLKDPETPTAEQLTYIKGYLQDTENAIFSADFADPAKGYARYINADSFISWFLVNEIFKNQDAQNFASMFYYKDRNGKLGMGPAWDFDLGAGNVDYSDATKPEGWWVHDGVWMGRLFKDPAFAARVKVKWDELKGAGIPKMFSSLDQAQAYLEFSQRRNFNRWNILNTYVWPNPVVLGSYPKEVAYFKQWLTKRIAWMDANIK